MFVRRKGTPFTPYLNLPSVCLSEIIRLRANRNVKNTSKWSEFPALFLLKAVVNLFSDFQIILTRSMTLRLFVFHFEPAFRFITFPVGRMYDYFQDAVPVRHLGGIP